MKIPRTKHIFFALLLIHGGCTQSSRHALTRVAPAIAVIAISENLVDANTKVGPLVSIDEKGHVITTAAISTNPRAFDDIINFHNDRIHSINSLWARSRYIAAWTEDNDPKADIGRGFLMSKLPNNLAISFIKLTENVGWLGCDDERIWLFDIEKSSAWVCRIENLHNSCADDFPLLCHPDVFLCLAGLIKIPTDDYKPVRLAQKDIWLGEDSNTQYAIEFTHRKQRIQILFDNDSMLPAGVAAYSPDNYAQGISVLGSYELIDGSTSTAPRTIMLFNGSQENYNSLFIFAADQNSNPPNQTDMPVEAFDFNRLLYAFNPKTIHVLDADCATPSMTPGPK